MVHCISIVLKDARERQTSGTSSNCGNARSRHDWLLDERFLLVLEGDAKTGLNAVKCQVREIKQGLSVVFILY